MTTKQIKLLAIKSFARGNLDPKRVRLFSSKMKRRDLRNYIREIKTIDAKNKVTFIVPTLKTFKKADIAELLKQYKSKRIIYQEDPNLLVGIKILDNDMISDFNLKNSLENLVETYD